MSKQPLKPPKQQKEPVSVPVQMSIKKERYKRFKTRADLRGMTIQEFLIFSAENELQKPI